MIPVDAMKDIINTCQRQMIKIAICDDEPLMAQELAGHLAEYMKEKSITAYDLSSFPDGYTFTAIR